MVRLEAAMVETTVAVTETTVGTRRKPGLPLIRLVFTIVSTTFCGTDVRGNEKKRELLPLSKMPEKPVVMGYTGI